MYTVLLSRGREGRHSPSVLCVLRSVRPGLAPLSKEHYLMYWVERGTGGTTLLRRSTPRRQISRQASSRSLFCGGLLPFDRFGRLPTCTNSGKPTPPNHVRCASTGQQAVSQNKPEQKQTEEGTNI